MSGRSVAAAAFLVALADRVTKSLVVSSMSEGESVAVIPGLLSFTYLRNPGAAFGLMAGLDAPWRLGFLITATALITVALVWMLAHGSTSRLERVAATMILGGAAGNLYDRIAWGEVVDFIDLYAGAWHWPAFNLADSCITVGALALAVASFGGGRRGRS